MRNQVWKNALSAGLMALASVGVVIGVEPFEWSRLVVAQELSQEAEQTIRGRLSAESETAEDGSYYNVHVFEAAAGQTFWIEMVSDEFDTYLVVFDAEGNKLAENDDGENGTNAQVSVTIPATGQYTIIANSLEAGETGDYILIIQTTQADTTSQDSSQPDAKAEANRLFQQGIQQHRVSQFRDALASWEAALQLFREINNREGEAASLGNVGIAYRSLGRYETAIDFLEQSLAIARELGNRQAEAASLSNMGIAYFSLGQYRTAIDYHEQSLSITREMGDRQGEAASLGNLGNAYFSLGQYETAIDYHEQSLDIAHQIGDRQGEANSLGNLGNVYYSLGQYETAINYHEQSLVIKREIGDRQGEANSLGNLGNVYYSLGQYETAINYHEQSLNFAREIGDRQGEAISFGSLGSAYDSLGQYEAAIDYYEQSLAITREIGDRQEEANVLSNLGVAYLGTQQYETAESVLSSAIEILEELRDSELPDASKVSLFETQVTSYKLLLQALVAQNKTNSALEVAERSRARALIELITDKISERAAEATITELPSLTEIQRTAQQQKATLVSYSIIDSQSQEPILYIWVIQPTGSVTFRQVDLSTLPDDALSAFVEQTRDSMNVRSRADVEVATAQRPPISQEEQRQNLKQLHQLLIDPIADLLPADPNERIIFIPQGALFLVPFAALIDENDQYLIENHTVSISPSIQTLALANQLSNPTASLTANPLIVGNPIMPTIQNPVTKETIQLIPLAGAENEAVAIAQLLNTNALLQGNASETVVAEQMQRASLIHFATHGLLSYGTLEESGVPDVPGAIALAPDSANDGLLTSAEIFAMQLQAELVVLSACNTGRGDITSDGVIGLSRSLMQAGVPSIVVSLWSVPDSSTEFLMKEFYANLEEMDKVQALRQAMLTTMQQPQYAQPVSWAAFTLVGEPE